MQEAIFKCGRPDSVISSFYLGHGCRIIATVDSEAREKGTIYHCAFGAPLCGC